MARNRSGFNKKLRWLDPTGAANLPGIIEQERFITALRCEAKSAMTELSEDVLTQVLKEPVIGLKNNLSIALAKKWAVRWHVDAPFVVSTVAAWLWLSSMLALRKTKKHEPVILAANLSGIVDGSTSAMKLWASRRLRDVPGVKRLKVPVCDLRMMSFDDYMDRAKRYAEATVMLFQAAGFKQERENRHVDPLTCHRWLVWHQVNGLTQEEVAAAAGGKTSPANIGKQINELAARLALPLRSTPTRKRRTKTQPT